MYRVLLELGNPPAMHGFTKAIEMGPGGGYLGRFTRMP
jgi:hypothetical protein